MTKTGGWQSKCCLLSMATPGSASPMGGSNSVERDSTDFEGTSEIQQLVIARAISGMRVKQFAGFGGPVPARRFGGSIRRALRAGGWLGLRLHPLAAPPSRSRYARIG